MRTAAWHGSKRSSAGCIDVQAARRNGNGNVRLVEGYDEEALQGVNAYTASRYMFYPVVITSASD